MCSPTNKINIYLTHHFNFNCTSMTHSNNNYLLLLCVIDVQFLNVSHQKNVKKK